MDFFFAHGFEEMWHPIFILSLFCSLSLTLPFFINQQVMQPNRMTMKIKWCDMVISAKMFAEITERLKERAQCRRFLCVYIAAAAAADVPCCEWNQEIKHNFTQAIFHTRYKPTVRFLSLPEIQARKWIRCHGKIHFSTSIYIYN